MTMATAMHNAALNKPSNVVTNLAESVGANSVAMNPATITAGVVRTVLAIANSVAAAMCHSTIKFNVADMSLSTTAKQYAVRYHSTTMLIVASIAKNGFAIANANISHVTTTSSAVSLAAAMVPTVPAMLVDVTEATATATAVASNCGALHQICIGQANDVCLSFFYTTGKCLALLSLSLPFTHSGHCQA